MPWTEKLLQQKAFQTATRSNFFDYMQAVNETYYIKISRGDRQQDGTYIKKEVVFFEEDFEWLLSAMSSLFRTAGYQRAAIDEGRRASAVSEERTTGIKSWEPQYRPREKMIMQGPEAMSDAELIAMLISSGSPRETAVELAGRMLASVDFNLRRFSD